jgi:predicted phosphoribosyltransferase
MPIHTFTERETGAYFRDRGHAGECLAEALMPYHGPGTIVLGIPRGGVPVAAAVSRRLGSDLDVVVARKLGAPANPELAIGAVTANGGRYLNESIIEELGVSNDYLEDVTEKQMTEAHGREARFRAGRDPISCRDRIVLIVDDGLATGATMRAAVRSMRKREPLRIVVGVPVGSVQACDALRTEVDAVVCLHELDDFWAVGVYYEHFEPVEDDTVERILRDAHAPALRRETAIATQAPTPTDAGHI